MSLATQFSIKNFLRQWHNRNNAESHSQSVFYTASTIAISLSRIIAGIVIVKVIMPEELGIWHTVRLALTYALILLLGVNYGLNRELPYYLGAKNAAISKKLTAVSQWYNLLCAGLVLIIGAAISVGFYLNQAEWNVQLAVIAVTLLIAGMFYRQFLIYLYQSTNTFRSLSNIQFIEAAFMLLTIPLLFWFGYEGMLIRIICVLIIVVCLLHFFRPLRVKPLWDKKSFLLLVKTGLPIFLLEYLLLTAETADRLVILHFADVTTVGYYGLAAVVYSTFQAIPVSIGSYLYPRLTFSYGKNNNPKDLWSPAWKISLLIMVIMLPIAVAGYYLLPPVINTYFSEYAPGIPAAQIMLFVTAFSGGAVGAYALWSLKAWRWLITYQVSLAIFVVALPYFGAIYFESTLIGVAVGLLIARFLSMITSLTCTYFATHGD